MKQPESADNPKPDALIETPSYFNKDVLVDLAWNLEANTPDFLVYNRNDQSVHRATQFKNSHGVMAVPAHWRGVVTPGFPLQGKVHVPTDCSPGVVNEVELRTKLHTLINKYVDLEPHYVSVCIDYILLSWIYDNFSELPYLGFFCPAYGSGKSRALEVVGLLCYRPMLYIGSVSAASLFREIHVWRGTVVIDEFEPSTNPEVAAEVKDLLNTGFRYDGSKTRCEGDAHQPKYYSTFGPKVFSTRIGMGEDATKSRTLMCEVTATPRTDIPISIDQMIFRQELEDLRKDLIAFRFSRFGTIHVNSIVMDPSLTHRSRQIGLPLMAISNTPESKTHIVDMLVSQETALAVDNSNTEEGEVLYTLLTVYEIGDTVRPNDVAKSVNERWEVEARRREQHPAPSLSKEKMGYILKKKLNIDQPRSPRDDQGIKYVLKWKRLEALSKMYGMQQLLKPKPLETSDDLPKCENNQRSGLPDNSVQSGVRAPLPPPPKKHPSKMSNVPPVPTPKVSHPPKGGQK